VQCSVVQVQGSTGSVVSVQTSTVQCGVSAGQYSAVKCQCSAVQCTALHCSKVPLQCSAVQCGPSEGQWQCSVVSEPSWAKRETLLQLFVAKVQDNK
jgi:hypothetical protein